MLDSYGWRLVVRMVVSLVVLAIVIVLMRRRERSTWLQRYLVYASVLTFGVAALGLYGRIQRADVPVRVVPTAGLIPEVRSARTLAVALVLYDPSCSRCRDVIGNIVEYGYRREENELGLIAVAFPGDPDRVRRFVVSLAGQVEGVQLAPYPSGSLVASLRPLGAKVPMKIGTPYVILLDEQRKVVAEWEAMERLADFVAVVDSLREAREARSPMPGPGDADATTLSAAALLAADSATTRPE